MSEEQRAERRRADRERLQAATRELLSSQGWERWVRARAVFHSYSLGNSLLLAHRIPAPVMADLLGFGAQTICRPADS